MVTLFLLPAGPLVRVSLIQSNSDFESTMPRLSVTSLTLCTPGDLADVVLLFVAVAVLGHGDLGADAGDVGEPAERSRRRRS